MTALIIGMVLAIIIGLIILTGQVATWGIVGLVTLIADTVKKAFEDDDK